MRNLKKRYQINLDYLSEALRKIEKYIFVTYHSLIRRFVGIDQAWRMRKNLSLLHELEKYFLENTITTLIR